MNKASVLRAPNWVHNGNFVASGTIWQMSICYVDTTATDVSSSEGVTYLQNKHFLKKVDTTNMQVDSTRVFYLAYKFPTEDDYLLRNNLSADIIADGEGVVGIRMVPGIVIQDYVGSDYTNSSGTKIGGLYGDSTWSTVTHGTSLYLTNTGQLSTAVISGSTGPRRAIFIEKKGNWVTYELV